MTPQIFLMTLALIAGIFYFAFPYINKRFFQRPFLSIELEPNKGLTMLRTHLGYSGENNTDLPINLSEAISIYEIEWKFNLVIRNNSEYDAYNIEIFNSGLENGNLSFKSKVSPNKPLPKHGEIIIPFEFSIIKKSQHKNVSSLNTVEPIEFSELEILLNYCNSQRRRFNTRFNMKTKKNTYENIDIKR